MTQILNTKPVRQREQPLRDKDYLDYLKEQPCIVTGLRATMHMSIDPAHIGTWGRSIKSPDNEALPLKHDLHAHLAHQKGEISFYRHNLDDVILREALRAYARELYQEYLITARRE